jgi:putative transposase
MPLSNRCQMVEKDCNISIAKQCQLLSLHRSRFYYKGVTETQENLSIMRWLDEQYFETPFFGVLRLTTELNDYGYHVNVKRVRRLMQLVGWKTLYQAPRTTITDKASYKYPYLLKGLNIQSRNQVWEIDITYLPMRKGFMYLFAIIDVYSRFIVNWGISNSMTAEWCATIIEEAIEVNGKPSIINSDQGSQFTSALYTDLLKTNEIQISMDGKGRAIDNIFIERFWRTIKYEHIYLMAYENNVTLFKGISKYIDFYNTKRKHQSLENKTPSSIYKNKMAA